MGNAARKARKRAGIPFVKAPKRRTRPYSRSKGLGLVKPQELHAALVVRGLL